MYKLYMSGIDEFSLFDEKSKRYLLSGKNFRETYQYLSNNLNLSKVELSKGFNSLVDNFHNTVEFDESNRFLSSNFTDFYSV